MLSHRARPVNAALQNPSAFMDARQSSLLDLPSELILSCLGGLPLSSLPRVSVVCTTLQASVKSLLDELCSDPSVVEILGSPAPAVDLLRALHLMEQPVTTLRVTYSDRNTRRSPWNSALIPTTRSFKSHECSRLLKEGLAPASVGKSAVQARLVVRFPPSIDKSWYEADAQSCEWRGATITTTFSDGDVASGLSLQDMCARDQPPGTLRELAADKWQVVVPVAYDHATGRVDGGPLRQGRWQRARVTAVVIDAQLCDSHGEGARVASLGRAGDLLRLAAVYLAARRRNELEVVRDRPHLD